jgi:hypothetical protein
MILFSNITRISSTILSILSLVIQFILCERMHFTKVPLKFQVQDDEKKYFVAV